MLPRPNRLGLVVAVIFDEGVRHIHPEAVATLAEPEAHDVDHGVLGPPSGRGIGRLLPGSVTLGEAEVERRLTFEEVQDIRGVAIAFPADERHRITVEGAVGPDVPVGVGVVFGLLTSLEPRVFLARVPRYQIEQDVDAASVRLLEQTHQVAVGPVSRRDAAVVTHIVSGILEWRVEAGVDPQRVASQSRDVVQFLDDALQVPDAVTVGIVKTLRVDLVEYRGLQPCRMGE